MRTAPHATTLPLLLAAPLALAAAPSASAAGLDISFTANGASLTDAPIGTTPPSGGLFYGGSLVLPAAQLTFEAIAMDSANLFLSGTLIVVNHLATPTDVDIELTHGLDAVVPGFIRRGSVVGLVPFGGAVSSQSGQLMHEHLADGIASPGLLPAGYASSAIIDPVTVLDSADIALAGASTSFGHRIQLVLDPGTTVVLNVVLRAQSMDLDDDGTIGGADLGILLRDWGQGGAADYNGDGIVDSADLGLLLQAWE